MVQLLTHISVQAANLSDCRIESNRKNRFGSENRIESNLNFFAGIGMLYRDVGYTLTMQTSTEAISNAVWMSPSTARTWFILLSTAKSRTLLGELRHKALWYFLIFQTIGAGFSLFLWVQATNVIMAFGRISQGIVSDSVVTF